MGAENIVIRNFTSTPITLKRIERFSPPPRDQDNGGNGAGGAFETMARNFTRALTNLNSTTTIAPIANDAKPFASEDVNIRVEPFGRMQTDRRAFDKSRDELTRLVIETDGGERQQIQIPLPTNDTGTFTPLVDHPHFRFTGVYVPGDPHLAVYSSSNLQKWMEPLKNETLLSSLSIPGTHNSPACYVAPPSVRCQAVSPREQLENGVRFFDLRIQPQFPEDLGREEILLVHGVFPIALSGFHTFKNLMTVVNEFLDRNPSETLIVSLKREGPGQATDEQLSRKLRDHYIKPDSRWYTEPKVPTLGETRGKIVLVRRFNLEDSLKGENAGRGWGIDASGWADNTPHAFCPSGHICVQDFYEVLETGNIPQKIQYVTEQISRSGETRYPFGIVTPEDSKRHPFYINFLSGSNFWKMGTWPEKIAAKLNPAVIEYLCKKHSEKDGDWSTGILVTDWVGLNGDWDLARCTVGMNAKLLLR